MRDCTLPAETVASSTAHNPLQHRCQNLSTVEYEFFVCRDIGPSLIKRIPRSSAAG